MIDTKSIRQFYRRLNHGKYGVTELVVINPNGGIIATGFFSDEDAFVKACTAYNGRHNIYAGRNPRPRWLPRVCMNYMDSRHRQRARDSDIQFVTAISLDIDPVRPRGTSATEQQHQTALEFAVKLRNEIGGWVDSSGNGAYLWLPFMTPISVTHRNRHQVKRKCRQWQSNIIRVHQPDRYGLRIDGCFDLSRVKKVIGTQSMKGNIHRLSRFVRMDKTRDDKVRNAILSLSLQLDRAVAGRIRPGSRLPHRFLQLLRTNQAIQDLWLTPSHNSDASMHDWALGCELMKAGIANPTDLARILMLNPFGKYQRDRRYSYIQTTVSKLRSAV